MSHQGFAGINVASVLAESARRYPDHTAISLGATRISYAQLWGQTLAYAGALRERGVGPGTKVALLSPNVPHFAMSYYAVLALGATVVPIHALLKRHEIQYVLEDSGASLLIAAAPLLGEGGPGAHGADIEILTLLAPEELGTTRLEDLAAEAEPLTHLSLRDPADIAAILYTSGTTGKPKGAMLSHFAGSS